METIELKDVMNQLPVADLIKNLSGTDNNGNPAQFSMENIAAVVGGKFGIRRMLIEYTPDLTDLEIDCRSAVMVIYDSYEGCMNAIMKDRFDIFPITNSLLFIKEGNAIFSASDKNKLKITYKKQANISILFIQ